MYGSLRKGRAALYTLVQYSLAPSIANLVKEEWDFSQLGIVSNVYKGLLRLKIGSTYELSVGEFNSSGGFTDCKLTVYSHPHPLPSNKIKDRFVRRLGN